MAEENSNRDDDEPSTTPTFEPVAPGTNWSFSTEDQGSNIAAEPVNPSIHKHAISWTASEYIAHEKDSSWFIGLGIGGVILGSVIYLITRDFISTGVVLAMVVIFGVFAARKPQTLEYSLDDQGLKIGPKLYPFSHFKSFAVIDEGAVFSVMLLPMKRFMPSLSIYYDQKDEKNIVDVLSGYLPIEERSHDLTDQLMRKIRF